MKTSTGTSNILFERVRPALAECVNRDKTIIITDENLFKYYSPLMEGFPVITIGTGEGVKNLNTAEQIYRQLLEFQIDRSFTLLGFGGGVITDITGFVGSTFLRGVDFGYVSTTLLSQVDASIGGKTGLNLDGCKNIIGTFHQPRFVICDVTLLSTLTEEEYRNGFSEMVKHGIIAGEACLRQIEEERERLLARDPAVLEEIVSGSVEIKWAIVTQDERESGLRRVLNLGHTIGHAVESVLKVPHGAAVSLGIAAELELAKELSAFPEEGIRRIRALLADLGLPVELTALQKKGDTLTRLKEALVKDKKRYGEEVLCPLPDRIGNVEILSVPMKVLTDHLDRFFGEVL
ncbi:MAG: 3-dehydroquinate synthase [Spirochaetales bacterium]|nr:3-dehydroquinate synthase [Spirochaetales bacterium]